MIQLRLREATVADSDFIYQVVESTMRSYVEQVWGSFSEDYNRRNIAEAISMRSYSIIVIEERDVGALAVERCDTHIQLTQLYVIPAYQNRGIGTTLVRKLISEAKDLGKPLRLRVLSSNPARRLYEREGFRVTSTTPERFFMEIDPRTQSFEADS
jgi:ribosomal protein S18 acetylase RimI-like enzyme